MFPSAPYRIWGLGFRIGFYDLSSTGRATVVRPESEEYMIIGFWVSKESTHALIVLRLSLLETRISHEGPTGERGRRTSLKELLPSPRWAAPAQKKKQSPDR